MIQLMSVHLKRVNTCFPEMRVARDVLRESLEPPGETINPVWPSFGHL